MRHFVSRIFYRCVDWKLKMNMVMKHFVSRIFYRCVDWNKIYLKCVAVFVSRIFYRCVDWNWYGRCLLALSAVASFTDAWIETLWKLWLYSYPAVASFTDAWIETPNLLQGVSIEMSHLLQMRGLKRVSYAKYLSYRSRIFYRCVDWNLGKYILIVLPSLSHLLQMRGLKRNISILSSEGLYVASFTDAWIETIWWLTIRLQYRVASFTDAWIVTFVHRHEW